MRWLVHGTDATTGRNVTLAVDDEHATHAVQNALGKRIIVTHVTRGLRQRLQLVALPMLVGTLLLLLPLVVTGLVANKSARNDVAALAQSYQRTLADLNVATAALTESQRKIADLEIAAGDQSKHLVSELERTRGQLNGTVAELTATRRRLEELQAATSAGTQRLQDQLVAAKRDLATREQLVRSLEEQVRSGSKNKTELDAARKGLEKSQQTLAAAQSRSDKLDAANRDLLKQLESMKAALAEAVAKQAETPVPEAAVEIPRLALRTSYDNAFDFMNLHFKDRAGSKAPDGVLTLTATQPELAAQLSFRTDRQKVFDSRLLVSLAPDAPKEVLAANTQLLGQYAKVFAPQSKDADTWLASAVAHLQGKPATDRMVYAADDFTLTIHNNKVGLFTVQVKPVMGGE